MEFPPEIVSIIREYSKPYFKHFRIYKRVLAKKHLDEWPALKESLLRQPDKILPLVESYERAVLAFEAVSQAFQEPQDPDIWYEIDLDLQYYQKQKALLNAERNLQL
jgi:hypothetical protein